MQARDFALIQSLPVDNVRREFTRACAETARVLVTAPTGSGKSTRFPGFLADDVLSAGLQVVCLQPRRLAARMLARRVAIERGVRLGGEVGYRVRFDHKAGAATRILYETDGILLRELRDDPCLKRVGAIVFDEFHERHLFGDVLLGLALQLQRGPRPDLKVVVMSATLDIPRLEEFLAPCRKITASGRLFPVDIRYHEPGRARHGYVTPIWDQVVDAMTVLPEQSAGHTLIFMPGAHEIRRTVSVLQASPVCRNTAVMPLYGGLPPAAQDAAAAPSDQPKIIVATNIAETSITIPGITAVIDSGLVRRAGYDPEHGINTLLVEKISRASADQRAGRAGRTAPGVCLRLWPETEQAYRPAQEMPEIVRLDLSEVIMCLHALGVSDPGTFPWLTAPAADRLAQTEAFLRDIGAICPRERVLTALGHRMLDFPLHPRWSRLLLTAAEYDCVPSAALLAALAQERGMLVNLKPPDRRKPGAMRMAPRGGAMRQSDLDRGIRDNRRELIDPAWESDLILRLRLWQEAAAAGFSRVVCDKLGLNIGACRRVGEMRDQFVDIAERTGLPVTARTAAAEQIAKCLLAAFPDQVACRVSAGAARVEMVHGRRGVLEADSTVRHAVLLVAPEIRRVESRRGETETRISMAGAIAPEWLTELYPQHLRHTRRVEYDTAQRRVTARADVLYHDLVIGGETAGQLSADEAAACLAAEVTAGRLTLKNWDAAVEQFILRLNNLADWCPDLGMPAIGDEERLHLIEQICHGAYSYREIKERAVMPVVRTWLSVPQQELLAKHAPERVTLANRRSVKLVYEESRAPAFSARIQELYDVPECPKIALGRVRVRANILAPNQRPVQITDDLASFWDNGYPQARKDLRGRYPKHEWR